MQSEPGTRKDLYYTAGHEWIDFQGAIAYVGVCTVKLTGLKEIQSIKFKNPEGFKKQGDLLISIRCQDCLVDVYMPVDGTITAINRLLIDGDKNILLQQPEGNGWVVKIVPAQPDDRRGLVPANEYGME